MTTWIHPHIGRLRSGNANPISVKIPGQRLDYASWVSLRNARFVVHESGRRRCLDYGVRNVHAWVVGDEILRVADFPVKSTAPVTWRTALYCPWKGSTFVDSVTLEPVYRADLVIASGRHVYYCNEGE